MIIRLKRGTSQQIANYTGSSGELVFNTETGLIHFMDGTTPGGKQTSQIEDISEEIAAIDSKWAKEGTLANSFGFVGAGYYTQVNSSSLNMLNAPPRHDWTVSATHSITHTNYNSQFGFHFNNKNNVLVFKTDYHKYMGLRLDIPLEDQMFYTTYYNGYDFEANSTKIADYFANPGNYSEIVTYDASVNGYNGPLNDWTSGQTIRSVDDVLFIVQGAHQNSQVRDGRIVKFNVNTGAYIGQITTNHSEQYEYFQQFAVNSTHIAIRKSKADFVEIHTHGGTGSPSYVKAITEQTGLSSSFLDNYGWQPNMNEDYLTFGSPGFHNTPTAPNPYTKGAVEVYDTTNFNLIGRLLPGHTTKNFWTQSSIYGQNLSSTNYFAATYSVNGSNPVEKIIYLYDLNGMTGDRTPIASLSSTENNFGRFLEFAVIKDTQGNDKTLLIVPIGEDSNATDQKIKIYDATNGSLLTEINSFSHPDLFPDAFDTANAKSQIIAVHANPEGLNYSHADSAGLGRDFLMVMGTRSQYGMAKASLYMENGSKRKINIDGNLVDFESNVTSKKDEKNNLLVKLSEIEGRLTAGGL